MPKDFIRLATEGTGPRVQNIAVQTYVDHNDGNGPQLVTLYMQAATVTPVDANGNLVESDEYLIGAEWKTQLLDEMRAIRIGMERLIDNNRFMADEEQGLLEQAQGQREEKDDINAGREAAENQNQTTFPV